jgi:uncharacterized protein YceH (UPF0502 family)
MTEESSFPFGVPLDPVEQRVLGSLIEKEIATPEQYPLSLNALLNACNQRSSREPVMDLAEREVREALDSLEALALVYPLRDTRVTKYEHRIRTVLNLRRDETALLCLLLLRGAQTPGELRSRADRLYAFDDLAAVQATLERLAARSSAKDAGAQAAKSPAQAMPLVMQMARQPGSREARFVHLLGEAVSRPAQPPVPSGSVPERVEQLEAEIFALRNQLGTVLERIQRLEDECLTALS